MSPVTSATFAQSYKGKVSFAAGGTLGNNAKRKVLFTYYKIERSKSMVDRYMTVTEIAEFLKVSYDTALEFVKYSGVESVKVGRQYRVLESKLNEFLYPPKVARKKILHRPIYNIVERS